MMAESIATVEPDFKSSPLYRSLVCLLGDGYYYAGQVRGPGAQGLQANLRRELQLLGRAISRTVHAGTLLRRTQLMESARVHCKAFCTQLSLCRDLGYLLPDHHDHLLRHAGCVERQMNLLQDENAPGLSSGANGGFCAIRAVEASSA